MIVHNVINADSWAMVLGSIQFLRCSKIRQGSAVLAVGAAGGCLGIFLLSVIIFLSPFSLLFAYAIKTLFC